MSNEQLSVKELMKKYGYSLSAVCHCDGFETHKYKNERREFRWRKFKFQFMILEGRAVISNWKKITELQSTMEKLHTDVAV